ncbi:MAG: AAA family ATPase, partial [Myxococcota bacterium]
MDDHLLLRGAKLDAKRTEAVLNHFFETNLRLEERGLRGTPVCIWGTHGIGKTSLVADLAKRKGWHFAYCAPGQFEEMGDLHGLPVRMEADGERRAHTAFLPPEWVPQMPGPGILLLDDLNRADERILRGLMQLLQNHALFSWALPHQWQIVA